MYQRQRPENLFPTHISHSFHRISKNFPPQSPAHNGYFHPNTGPSRLQHFQREPRARQCTEHWALLTIQYRAPSKTDHSKGRREVSRPPKQDTTHQDQNKLNYVDQFKNARPHIKNGNEEPFARHVNLDGEEKGNGVQHTRKVNSTQKILKSSPHKVILFISKKSSMINTFSNKIKTVFSSKFNTQFN